MMVSDLPKLLKEVIEQNEVSWKTLKEYFEKNQLSDLEKEQVHLYLKQMSKNNIHAIYIRAWLHEHGYGVKADAEMAFVYMREAASYGHKEAIFEVGKRLLFGKGIEKNTTTAL